MLQNNGLHLISRADGQWRVTPLDTTTLTVKQEATDLSGATQNAIVEQTLQRTQRRNYYYSVAQK